VTIEFPGDSALALLVAEVKRAITNLEDAYVRQAPKGEISALQSEVDMAVKRAHDAWDEDAKREYLERKAREWGKATVGAAWREKKAPGV
jgi:hypothetical protein